MVSRRELAAPEGPLLFFGISLTSEAKGEKIKAPNQIFEFEPKEREGFCERQCPCG